jgi:hypothetical protein
MMAIVSFQIFLETGFVIEALSFMEEKVIAASIAISVIL